MRLCSLMALLMAGVVSATPALGRQAVEGQCGPWRGALIEDRGAALEELALGAPAYIIVGDVWQIEPDLNRLVVSTAQGNQPLDVTARSNIRNSQDEQINLDEIDKGQRVFVAFDRLAGRNEVRLMYRLRN